MEVKRIMSFPKLASYLLVAVCAAPSLPAQELVEDDRTSLTIAYFTPEHGDAHELVGAASQLFGQQTTVRDSLTRQLSTVSRFYSLGGAIVIRDRVTEIEPIVEFLRNLDRSLAGSGSAGARAPELVELSYSPRYITPESALSALASFQRRLPSLSASSGQGTTSGALNITLVPDQSMLVVRDTAEQIQAMQRVLETVDISRPQLTLLCYLLRGTSEPGAGAVAPAELTGNLSELVPFEHFELVKMGLLRTAVTTSREISLQMNTDEATYLLSMSPTAYHPEQQELTLSNCKFAIQSRSEAGASFQTSTSIRAGEYTVLGAVGAAPIFVVLAIQPLGSAH